MAKIDQYVKILDSQDKIVEVNLRDIIYLRGADMANLLAKLGFESDFNDSDFNDVLERMLARIPGEIDKRQGSIIYDTLASAAVELCASYCEREANRALSFASMSHGNWLDLRVAEHGVFRAPPTKAIRWGFFWADVEKTVPFNDIVIGAKYSINKINFVVFEKVSQGVFLLECEEFGEAGNIDYGELLPVEYVQGLVVATIGHCATPGENEEDDDSLYERFVRWITRPPFGGNRSDYEEYFRKIDGVLSVKLFRANPKKGYVKAIILGADTKAPSDAFVEKVQKLVDPNLSEGEGIGMAPMAHIVNVYGAKETQINVSCNVVVEKGIEISQVEGEIEETIKQYLKQLRNDWATYAVPDRPEYIRSVVRSAVIDAKIIEIEGIVDVFSTTLNGEVGNITLQEQCVAVFGGLEIRGENYS